MADSCNHFSFSGAAGSFEMSPSLPGPPGPAGKSAYEAAQEGGYTGTEAQFNAALAAVDTALQPSDVDAELSDSSENPVQNKVIMAAFADQQNAFISVADKNLFDKTKIVIGVNAAGAATGKRRALSGPMYVNGQATVNVVNLPTNIKYEIEYYTGEAASTYAKTTNKWRIEAASAEFADKYPFIRILFGSIDDADFSYSDFEDLVIVVNKGITNTDYIKVCTWNVGLWYNGNPHGMAMDLLYKWYRIIGDVDADIFMTQESPEALSDGSELTVSDLMGFKYDYISLPIAGDGIYQAKTICTKHPFFDATKKYYSVGSRLYWKAYIYLNNKKVCIINTHLTVDDTYRPTQLQELLNLMIAEDYVIVCGDFNVKATTEFDIFTDAGFKLANCGMFGDFITCPNDANNKMLDNCIVSSNIAIQNVETVAGTGGDHISDHVALLTTLRI